jgi:nicotinate-nucleotide adenylyltransferase
MTIPATESREPVGIFGGTFDPIHIGHLRTAFELLGSAGLREIRFIPSNTPPHRAPATAPGDLRLRMIAAAVAGQPGFVADDRELRRPGPSWSVDTLQSLRAEAPDQPVCLILGMDAFLGLPTWHRWQEVLQLAHIIVARRPGSAVQADGIPARLLAERQVHDRGALRSAAGGSVLVCEVTQLDIASSAIRQLVAGGGDPRFLVPDPVRALVLESRCYGAGAAGPEIPKEVHARAK